MAFSKAPPAEIPEGARASLPGLVDDARRTLDRAAVRADRIVLAYSGGKDSLVACHLARTHLGLRDAVCEVSFYFRRHEIQAMENAGPDVLDLDCEFRDSLGIMWLRRNPHVLFSDDNAVRSWTFSTRQQRTVKKYARKHGFDAQLFGRRTEENSVRAPLYRTRAGLQIHPIRDWSTLHVWAYVREHGLPEPWIYSTAFGRLEGNAPFYTLRASDVGGYAGAWDLVSSLDERFTPENLGVPETPPKEKP